MSNNTELDSMSAIKARWPMVVAILEENIDRLGLEYADNLRVARVEDSWEKASYEHARRSGCCGSYEDDIVFGGVKFWIGCNYGH